MCRETKAELGGGGGRGAWREGANPGVEVQKAAEGNELSWPGSPPHIHKDTRDSQEHLLPMWTFQLPLQIGPAQPSRTVTVDNPPVLSMCCIPAAGA